MKKNEGRKGPREKDRGKSRGLRENNEGMSEVISREGIKGYLERDQEKG